MTDPNNRFAHADERRPSWTGDVTGAFADLGTFLPLVVGVLLVGGLEPARVLIGFGAFALATGLLYRCPVPIQPMKAISALVITGAVSASVIPVTGILIGLVFVVLGATGWSDKLARIVPRSILLGIQLALGLTLIGNAAALQSGWALAVAVSLTGGLVALGLTRIGAVGCLVLLIAGIVWGVAYGAPVPTHVPASVVGQGALLPSFSILPEIASALLPQLAMTLTNAVLLTAVLAREYFPESSSRVTPRRLSLSTGILNLCLSPLGALPMCHGAGGIAVQYAQGARTGLAPVLFGASCLGIALAAGSDALRLLQLVPIPVVAALLAFAGLQLIDIRRLREVRPDCIVVIAATLVVALVFNYALGLLAGLAVEHIRGRIASGRLPEP